MANKKDNIVSLIDTFAEFKETKNIDRATLVGVLEESFRSVLAKMFGSDENLDIIVNPDKGDCEIHRNRVVVADDEVTDLNKEISLSEARKIDADYEIGEDVSESIDFMKSGRRGMNSGLPAFVEAFHPKRAFIVGTGGVSLEDFLSCDIESLLNQEYL